MNNEYTYLKHEVTTENTLKSHNISSINLEYASHNTYTTINESFIHLFCKKQLTERIHVYPSI